MDSLPGATGRGGSRPVSYARVKKDLVTLLKQDATAKQEQIVHMQARTGSWQMAHQSVKCLKCEQCFDVVIPDAIVA